MQSVNQSTVCQRLSGYDAPFNNVGAFRVGNLQDALLIPISWIESEDPAVVFIQTHFPPDIVGEIFRVHALCAVDDDPLPCRRVELNLTAEGLFLC